MARKKTITKEDKILEEKFEEILDSVDAGKKNSEQNSSEDLRSNSSKKVPEEASEYVVNACLDSNRALKLEICDQIEKINNSYYLSIILKYIKQLGG